VTTADTTDEHPIDRFNRIKKEIDLIEKDLEFYKKNVKNNNKNLYNFLERSFGQKDSFGKSFI